MYFLKFLKNINYLNKNKKIKAFNNHLATKFTPFLQ